MNHLCHFSGSGTLHWGDIGNMRATSIRNILIDPNEKCLEKDCTFTLGQIGEVCGKYKPKKDIIISPVDL